MLNRVIAIVGVLATVTSLAILALTANREIEKDESSPSRPTAHAQEGGDPRAGIGRFRSFEIAKEEAGFTGSPFVNVFLTPGDGDFGRVSAILSSPEVAEIAKFFSGAIIDPNRPRQRQPGDPETEVLRLIDPEEADVEAFRRDQGLQVVVRGLNGAFLGALPTGFTQEDLMALLESILENHSSLSRAS